MPPKEFLARQLGIDPSEIQMTEDDTTYQGGQQPFYISGYTISQFMSNNGLLSISPDGSITFPNISIQDLMGICNRAVKYAQQTPSSASARGAYVVSPPTVSQLCQCCQSESTGGTDRTTASSSMFTTTTFNIVPVLDMTYIFGNLADEQLISLYGSNSPTTKNQENQICKTDLAAAKHACMFTNTVTVLPSSDDVTADQRSISGKKGSWEKAMFGFLKVGCPCCLKKGRLHIIKKSGSSGEVGNAISIPKTLMGLKLSFRTVRDHMLECPLVPDHIKNELHDGLGDLASATKSDRVFAMLIQELSSSFTTTTPFDTRKRTVDEVTEDESNDTKAVLGS